jgi:hypothetical protein
MEDPKSRERASSARRLGGERCGVVDHHRGPQQPEAGNALDPAVVLQLRRATLARSDALLRNSF